MLRKRCAHFRQETSDFATLNQNFGASRTKKFVKVFKYLKPKNYWEQKSRVAIFGQLQVGVSRICSREMDHKIALFTKFESEKSKLNHYQPVKHENKTMSHLS